MDFTPDGTPGEPEATREPGTARKPTFPEFYHLKNQRSVKLRCKSQQGGKQDNPPRPRGVRDKHSEIPP